MQTLKLVVHLEGATPEELARAEVAAMAVFGAAGVTPLRAAEADFAREGWDVSGFDPDYEGYDAADAEIANVWGDAEDAARAAGCAGKGSLDFSLGGPPSDIADKAWFRRIESVEYVRRVKWKETQGL